MWTWDHQRKWPLPRQQPTKGMNPTPLSKNTDKTGRSECSHAGFTHLPDPPKKPTDMEVYRPSRGAVNLGRQSSGGTWSALGLGFAFGGTASRNLSIPTSGNSALGCASHPGSGEAKLLKLHFPRGGHSLFQWTAFIDLLFSSPTLVLPMLVVMPKSPAAMAPTWETKLVSAQALSSHGGRLLLFYGWALLPLP